MHAVADTPLWLRAVSLVGLAVMVALAWAISYDRKAFP
jgi:nucleoside permease NupC